MRWTYTCLLALVVAGVTKVVTTDCVMVGDPGYLAVGFWGHGQACDVWVGDALVTDGRVYQVWGDTVAVVNE
jgi:hypothetical protein